MQDNLLGLVVIYFFILTPPPPHVRENEFFSFCCLSRNIKLGVNFTDNSSLNVFLQELFKPAQEVAVVTLNQPRLHIAL